MAWTDWLLGTGGVPESAPSPDQDRALVLYKYDSCPFCRRVQSRISSLGLEVEMRDIQTESGMRSELASRTGRTQVPCLFIDDQPLFESADINAWLDAYAQR